MLPKILFICNSLTIRSHWLFRLISNIEDEIGCIVANRLNTNKIKVPQKSLNPPSVQILRRIDENLNCNFVYPYILFKAEKKFGTTINYIHFISFAIKSLEFIKKSKSPTVIHCHGKDIMWDLKDFHTQQEVYNEEYLQKVQLLAKYAFFIANSNFTKNQLLKLNIPSSRIFINHFGVEIPKIELPKTTKNRLFNILFLGRLVDVKGPLEVITAYEILRRKGIPARLIIAGGGELFHQCQEKINQSSFSKDIELLGWVNYDKAQELFLEADVFTAHNKIDKYTNQVEAFGVSIIEAMSYGLPVLTGNMGGLEDSVVHGVTGFLFEPGNVKMHAKRLEELYLDEELRCSMGIQGRKRVEKRFNLKKEKEGLRNILKQINEAKNV